MFKAFLESSSQNDNDGLNAENLNRLMSNSSQLDIGGDNGYGGIERKIEQNSDNESLKSCEDTTTEKTGHYFQNGHSDSHSRQQPVDFEAQSEHNQNDGLVIYIPEDHKDQNNEKEEHKHTKPVSQSKQISPKSTKSTKTAKPKSPKNKEERVIQPEETLPGFLAKLLKKTGRLPFDRIIEEVNLVYDNLRRSDGTKYSADMIKATRGALTGDPMFKNIDNAWAVDENLMRSFEAKMINKIEGAAWRARIAQSKMNRRLEEKENRKKAKKKKPDEIEKAGLHIKPIFPKKSENGEVDDDGQGDFSSPEPSQLSENEIKEEIKKEEVKKEEIKKEEPKKKPSVPIKPKAPEKIQEETIAIPKLQMHTQPKFQLKLPQSIAQEKADNSAKDKRKRDKDDNYEVVFEVLNRTLTFVKKSPLIATIFANPFEGLSGDENAEDLARRFGSEKLIGIFQCFEFFSPFIEEAVQMKHCNPKTMPRDMKTIINIVNQIQEKVEFMATKIEIK